jgi:hypothetical protein
MEKVGSVNTEGFLILSNNAEGRNRSVYIDRVAESIDPDGVHILVMSLVHNDVELRTLWYVKIKSSLQPEQIWLDVDFDVFNSVITYTEEMEEGDVAEYN